MKELSKEQRRERRDIIRLAVESLREESQDFACIALSSQRGSEARRESPPWELRMEFEKRLRPKSSVAAWMGNPKNLRNRERRIRYLKVFSGLYSDDPNVREKTAVKLVSLRKELEKTPLTVLFSGNK